MAVDLPTATRVGAAAVTPGDVRKMLEDGGELALLDVREELTFSQAHLLHARSLPFSRLELRIARLVPRLGTRIVLCDGGDGTAERAQATLASCGYTDVAILQGGVAAWEAAGFLLFSGVNVPSKAFGEFVEHTSGTPNIAPEELHRRLHDGTDLVIVDSRPFDEYARVSIPTATNVPGAELALRIHDIAPSPGTTVVVNCAGRTRSIIGAQSLINAGIPNKVVALRNGTMGWTLAGQSCESGKSRRADAPSAEGRARAQSAAARVARRFGIAHIDLETLRRWRAEGETRTLYLFDVRDPAEYKAGHVAGAIAAPGGQLVQATDQYIGTLGARIVLVDDADIRAVMTASWLVQMGWKDVFVLAEKGTETGEPALPIFADRDRPEHPIDAPALERLRIENGATIVDLSLSREYRKGHIAGAWFAIRGRLERALAKIPMHGTLVLTSEDGVLAALAVAEAKALVAAPVRYLDGGNGAWVAAGYLLASGDSHMADEPIDVWLKPYERPTGTTAAMAEYLSWETDLLDRIERDGTCRFRAYPT